MSGQLVFVLAGTARDVCKAVNLKAMGADGILAKANTALAAQCFGAALHPNFKVVFAKDASYLKDAATADTTTLPPPGLAPRRKNADPRVGVFNQEMLSRSSE